MTTPRLPPQPAAPDLYPEPSEAFAEVLRLASLARAMDPSLPEHVRFYQRGPADEVEAGQAPARVLFTTDTRPTLEEGIQDPHVVDLFDSLGRHFPDATVQQLKERLARATQAPDDSKALARAFAASGQVPVDTRPTHDPEVVIASSPALAPSALEFCNDSFLNYLALSNFTRMRLPGEDPAFDYLAKVNAVRQALSRDASTLSAAQISRVVEAIRDLDGAQPGSFESTHGQGWLAYSAMAGGKGWMAPLLKGAPDAVNPYAPHQGVSPMAAAVVANDPQAVQVLLDQGVSPNVYLDSVPRAMNPVQHEVLAERLGDRFTLASLAAAMGNSASLGALSRGGALLNAPGEDGKTPLHHAVESGSEAAVRTLINNGADPSIADAQGNTPSMLAQGALRQALLAPPVPEQRGPAASAPSLGGV